MGKNQNPEMKNRRLPFFKRQLVVNRKVQYSLLAWVIFIAVFFSFYSIASMMTWQLLVGDATKFSDIPAGRLALAILLIWSGGIMVLAISVFAANCVSNRLVGPLWRLEKHMKGILNGNPPTPIQCREKDQFEELVATYNKLIEKIPRN